MGWAESELVPVKFPRFLWRPRIPTRSVVKEIESGPSVSKPAAYLACTGASARACVPQ